MNDQTSGRPPHSPSPPYTKPVTVTLVTLPYDQNDLLPAWLDWHLLNPAFSCITHILALDFPTSESRRILDDYRRRYPGRVEYVPLESVSSVPVDIGKFQPGNYLVETAREWYHPDWVIHCDVDEFLRLPFQTSLTDVLTDPMHEGTTILEVPRRTVIGSAIPTGVSAMAHLTDIVVRPQDDATPNLPFVLAPVQPHLAVRTKSFLGFGAGLHSATSRTGVRSSDARLTINTYPFRSYEALYRKVCHTRDFFQTNSQLPLGWGWHWRRWIAAEEASHLSDLYSQEFPTEPALTDLRRTGTIRPDSEIARFLASVPEVSRIRG